MTLHPLLVYLDFLQQVIARCDPFRQIKLIAVFFAVSHTSQASIIWNVLLSSIVSEYHKPYTVRLLSVR